MEAVITVSIMGILAAVVTPTYLETQNEAKLVMSKTNVSQMSQGIINLYLGSLFESESDVWPAEPADHKSHISGLNQQYYMMAVPLLSYIAALKSFIIPTKIPFYTTSFPKRNMRVKDSGSMIQTRVYLKPFAPKCDSCQN